MMGRIYLLLIEQPQNEIGLLEDILSNAVAAFRNQAKMILSNNIYAKGMWYLLSLKCRRTCGPLACILGSQSINSVNLALACLVGVESGKWTALPRNCSNKKLRARSYMVSLVKF
jgi:hypothetical protein